MPDKLTKIFYICAAILLTGVFLVLLYQPIEAAFHEQDLWWMVPIMSFISEGHSFFENFKESLFNPYPTYQGDPWMSIYISSVLATFGFQAKYFIFVSLILHFLCAFLLYSVLRKMDLDFRTAFFSALAYLAMFIHFGYYIWPMSSHHLFVLFFSLLVLNLYFETTKRIDGNSNWKNLFWITIGVNFLASLCQITILLLPVAILAHILISAKDSQDRLKKYDIWMPFFITYLGFPVMRFIYVGYVHLERFIGVRPIGSSSIALFPIIFLLGIGALLLFRVILELYSRYRLGKILRNLCIAAIVLYLFVFIAVYGRNDLVSPSKVKLYEFLSPYNFIRPFGMMFVDFIFPLKAALSANTTMPYYAIPPQDNIIGNLICLFLIILFMSKYFFRHKGLIVFLIFYIVALRYMRITTTLLYSRHFLYVTPLFSIVFCSSFIYIYDLIAGKVKLKKIAREALLILIFIGLCIPNVLAIRLEMLRGKMVNTFLIYDYIKIADIIKHDIGTGGRIKANDIYIEGIRSMPVSIDSCWSPALDVHLRFDPFRYVFAQTLNDKRMFNVNVNKGGGTAAELTYSVKDFRIYDARNSNIDKFSLYFDEAVKELRSGNDEKASLLFEKAVEIKPFLLNYVLSKYELKDLKWITGRSDLKSWISDIIGYYNFGHGSHRVDKITYISSTINDEINSYIECLFYEAYLSHILGRPEKSKELLFQIRFLESDYGEVSSLLDKELPVRSDKRMLDFLHNMDTVRGSS